MTAGYLSEHAIRHEATYGFLGLSLTRHHTVDLAALADNLEEEVLYVGLNLSVGGLAPDETLRVEDSVVGVYGDLVLCGVANETLGVGEDI